MQEREPGSAPEKDETLTPQPGGEFLAAWRRLRHKKETDEDDDTEAEKPKSRRSRFLSSFKNLGLFKRIARKEEVSTGWFKDTAPEEPGEQDRPIASSQPSFEGVLTINHEEAVQEVPARQERPNQLTKEDTERPNSTNQQVVEVQQGSSKPAEALRERAGNTASDPLYEQRQSTDTISGRPELMHPLFDGSSVPLVERATVGSRPRSAERVVERRSGEPLAVLEYFLRKKAVRNSERRSERRMKKEVATFNDHILQEQEAHRRLEQLARQSHEQLSELKRKRHSAERPEAKIGVTRPPEVPPPILQPERLAPAAEQVEKVKTARKSRRSPEVQSERTATRRPEQVLEQVAHAAEKDAPIEKAYERRHEIKDEPHSRGYGAAVPIGAVLDQTLQQAEFMRQEHSRLVQAAKQQSTAQIPQLYKQAATQGFWGAIVIIVFAFILLIVR